MKTKISMILWVLFVHLGWSQEILDQATPHLVQDYLYFDSAYYRLETAGTCMNGILNIQDEDTLRQEFLGYTTKALFSHNEHRWVALCNNREADDVGWNFISILYENETGQIQKNKTQEFRELWFSSFLLLNDSLLLFNNTEKDSLYFMDVKGDITHSQASEKPYESLYFFEGKILGIHENEMDVFDDSMQWIKTKVFTSSISQVKKNGSKLFLIFDQEVYQLDGAFQLIQSYEFFDQVLDISFLQDTLVIMDQREEELSLPYFLKGEVVGLEGVPKESFPNLHFQKFIKRDPALHMFGYQKMIDPGDDHIRHAIISTINNLHNSPFPFELYSIQLDTLEESKEIRDFYIDNLGDTILIYDYNYSFSFTISNESEYVTLDDCYVISTRKQAFNCAYTFYSKHFQDLHLKPGESVSVDAEFSPGFIQFEGFCLHLVSGNHLFEKSTYFTNVENNSSCRQLVNNDEVSKKEWFLYPNPVLDKLYLSTNTPYSKVEILSLEGKKLFESSKNSLRKIDVSGLTPGLYLLCLISEDGKRWVHRFIKQ